MGGRTRDEPPCSRLDPARSQGLADGSIRTKASIGELPTYTITAETPLANITGLKLEVLPDAELPGFGPGHKDGDFILAELFVDAASKTNAGNFTRARITSGAADIVAPGYDLAQTYNGIQEQGRKEGWSIGTAAAGRPHWAAYGFEKPVGTTNGSVFRFTFAFRYEAPYEIGRFRLWVTTSASPTAEGLPADVAQILKTPPQKRSQPQMDRLLSFLRGQNATSLERSFRLELARKPLPEDERQKELERELVRASRPVPVDPALAQLRLDVDASARQLAERRLTATQDLAWALINTPAFLFNR
jgi:hypothetical protein